MSKKRFKRVPTLFHKGDSEPQQLFRNGTVIIGHHTETDCELLLTDLSFHQTKINQILFNDEEMFEKRILSREEVNIAIALLHNERFHLKKFRSNYCNLIFSEN